MNRQQRSGYLLMAISALLLVLGTAGYSVSGTIDDIVTPNAPERTFFADDPLPEHTWSMFLSASVTITWERDDIYVVIVDEDEKRTCEAVPIGLINQESTTACGPFDTDVIASANDGDAGLIWEVQQGVYYAGIGTFQEGQVLPEGTTVDLSYEVHLQAAFATYFIIAIIGIGGFAYSKSE